MNDCIIDFSVTDETILYTRKGKRMKQLNRRDFLDRLGKGAAGTLTASTMLGSGLSCAPQQTAKKPNIIFILADDLGYGDLGCYGQTVLRTPVLDNMAAEGTRFTQCYAGSTVCAPSRSCLMTGTHTGHTRVRGNSPRIPLEPDDVCVAELMKEAGYATGIVGKWGVGEPGTTGIPNKQGFDYWFGYLNQRHAHNYYPDYLWRNEEKVQLGGSEYTHDLFTEEALDFIKQNHQQPFFLYLPYTIPHTNNELGRETGNGQEVPSDEPYSDMPWPQVEKDFAAMVTRMDRDIGRIFLLLKELGIDENTIVFFSSDNGPHAEGGHDSKFFNSSGPLRGIKRDLYEGGIRVPTIVRCPGLVPAGAVSDHIWTFWDVLPTCAEIAGVPAPQNIDGISMYRALLGEPQESHEFLYWEFHEQGYRQAVRYGNWKAVCQKFGDPYELYNLTNDIGEQNNVASRQPEVMAAIQEYLQTARTPSEHFPFPMEG